MAQPSVTGPGHIYVKTNYSPGIPNLSYLGVCETTPQIEFTPRFTPVHSDVAGAEVPHDWIYSGKDARLSGILTVWNWSILLAVMTRPAPVISTSPPSPDPRFGIDLAGARGTLMNTEGYSYTLWVQFPYFSKPAWGGFMPGGFHFFNSFLFGPDRFDMGTKPNRIPIMFAMTTKLTDGGNWVLCDSDMTGIPAIPPAAVA